MSLAAVQPEVGRGSRLNGFSAQRCSQRCFEDYLLMTLDWRTVQRWLSSAVQNSTQEPEAPRLSPSDSSKRSS